MPPSPEGEGCERSRIGAPLIRRFAAPSPEGEGFGRFRFPAICCLLGLAAGLLWCWGCSLRRLAPARTLAGSRREITAEVCAYPTEADAYQRVDAWVEAEGIRVKARLYLYGDVPPLAPGDRITGTFTLRRADRTASGESRLDLQAAGVELTASGEAERVVPGGEPFRYFPARWSRAVFDRLGELVPADAAGLLQAMLTGDRSGLGIGLREALSVAGASHIVAVSGLHAAMLLGLVFLLLGRSRFASILGLLVLALYVLMTGASPSVVRAALMLGLLLLAPIFGAENDPPTSLALAALVLLLRNPWTVANLSFQLSFAAVAGLLLVTPPLQGHLLALPWVDRLLKWDGLRRWPGWLRSRLLRGLRGLARFVCASLSATLGALCFSTPLSVPAFGFFPVYGVLTNLIALPLAALCLGGALGVLALGLVSTSLGLWAGGLLAWPVRAIAGLCRWVSRLPGARLTADVYGLAFLVFLYLCVGLVWLLRARKPRLLVPTLLVTLAAVLGLQRLEVSSASFFLAALDVNQGQCVCARAGDFTAVIDCGGTYGSSVGRDAAVWLRTHGADRIDALVLTHYDTDHMNGAAALLELIPVETLWLPDVAFDPGNRAAVENAARAAGTELRYVTQDQTLAFSCGTLRLFAPVSGRNDNAACVCVLFSVEEYDMLVTGDLDAVGELALLDRLDPGPVELYVAGHHGSARSSCQALLDAIQPKLVLISVGGNPYGLPNREALARFEAGGAEVWRTDQSGTLEVRR